MAGCFRANPRLEGSTSSLLFPGAAFVARTQNILDYRDSEQHINCNYCIRRTESKKNEADTNRLNISTGLTSEARSRVGSIYLYGVLFLHFGRAPPILASLGKLPISHCSLFRPQVISLSRSPSSASSTPSRPIFPSLPSP